MAGRNILPLLRWDRRNHRHPWSLVLWLCSGLGICLLLLWRHGGDDPRIDPLSLTEQTATEQIDIYSKDKTKSPTSKPSHKPSKSPTSSPTEITKQPHLIYLLVDDWGYGNWGYHRDEGFMETVTPNLDTLAEEGVVLENFYVHKNCSPTRSSLQTGNSSPLLTSPLHSSLYTSSFFSRRFDHYAMSIYSFIFCLSELAGYYSILIILTLELCTLR